MMSFAYGMFFSYSIVLYTFTIYNFVMFGDLTISSCFDYPVFNPELSKVGLENCNLQNLVNGLCNI